MVIFQPIIFDRTMTSPSAHRPLLSPQCRRRGKCFQTSPWCTARKENNYSIHWLHVNQYPQSNVATSQAYPRYPKFQYPPIIANTLVCEVETDRFKQEGESFGGSCAQVPSGHLAIAPIQDSISRGLLIYPSTSQKNSAENL